MKAFLYGKVFNSLATKKIDLANDTIKVMLCDDTYTPNQDTHQFLSDITGEIEADGYTAGGATLTGVALTYDGDTNTFTFDADDVEWEDATITARYAIVYDDTPATAATKPLIRCSDFESDVSSSNGPFKINWNAAGLVTLTAAAP